MLQQVDPDPTLDAQLEQKLEMLAELEPAEDAPEPQSRRKFAGFLTKTALGVVAGVAGLLSAKPAKAYYNYACCCLAKSPSGGYCAYNCWRYASSGYHSTSWNCRDAGITWTCFECASGTSCWSGPWLCSDYWAN